MSDNWNIEKLNKSEKKFKKLTIQEKYLCSCIANFNMELNIFQLEWLLKELSKKGLCEYTFSDEKPLSDITKKLSQESIIIENNDRYMVSDLYYPFAYRFPIDSDKEKFSLTLRNFVNCSDFAFEFSCKQNLFSSVLMDILSGNLKPDIFENFDYSFLNNGSEITIFNKILEPFDEKWFSILPEVSQIFLFNYAIHYELLHFEKIISNENQDLVSYFMKPKWFKSELFLSQAAHNLALYLIFKGDFERARSYIEVSTSLEAQGINAFLVYLFHGSNDSLNLFRHSLKSLQKEKSKRNITFFSLADIFYFIALLQDGSSDSLYDAKKHIEKLDKILLIYRPAYKILYEFYLAKIVGKYNSDKIANYLESDNSNSPFFEWLTCFIAFWIGYNDNEVLKRSVKSLLDRIVETQFPLIYNELLLLAKGLDIAITEEQDNLLKNWENNFIIPFVKRVQQKQKWEYVLDELSSKLNLSLNNNDNSLRIIWDLRINSDNSLIQLIPKEQQKLKNGNWSLGKSISLDNYFDDIKPFPEYFSSKDKLIYKKLQHSRAWANSLIESNSSVLTLLVNCSNVYLNGNFDSPVEILKSNPVLMLKENEEGLYYTFQPKYENESIKAIVENNRRIRIYEFSELQQQTASLLNENQIFPISAANRLKNLLNSLSNLMPVHNALESVSNQTPIASIASSSQIYIQLEPMGEGLKASFRVKPFGSNGPSFIPGKGDIDIFTEIAGQNLHTKRNIKLESLHFKELLNDCPILINNINEDCVSTFNTAELSLDFLLSIKDYPELITEWPENVKPKKVLSAKFSDFSFKINTFNEWFSIEGDLKIDENHVLSLQKLLKNYNKGSKFIQIDEDKFVAITEEFRNKIEDLKTFTLVDDQKNIFHKSVIKIMDDILSESGHITFDRSWHEMLNRIKHAEERDFIIPSSFKGELRSYQKDGFKWLSRMSFLGMGSCLADDMGLGKTIEALSIITARSSRGPAFVLAPTSVCSNWLNECQRFAPGLNPILFAQSDRKQVIKDLAPNDLIICSYGVLQREIEMLSQINWSTVILDEAQAIKNMSTNRSQAAMLLKGDFKMLMTGTPIENHLGELWNLFRFLNPGLLGSISSFNDKFAIPIQNFNDKGAQERLKKLVKPFILRRTKSQVLKDLPPRTEVTLNVDLSQEEAELYESVRREAIENINQNKNNKTDTKPMIVLAEIMKLRRLCCNPSLVYPNINIKSSKLSLLENITEELLANGHKTLIFSQFVDHLSIIRRFFDEKGYSYQYLDGSTPIRARNKAIKEFQEGNGDFFLISLKAGGQGINLTAADFVIHMDPWWNPAVEDQASDRAHRIGQNKPVTIYKLITSNTIEEKIVQLHGKKRDLADGLLEGTDLAGRISTQELISLINDSALKF